MKLKKAVTANHCLKTTRSRFSELQNSTMITLIHDQIEELTQEKYDQLISKLFNGQKLIKSPCCEGGVLEKHGYYERGYKALNGREEIIKFSGSDAVPAERHMPYC